MTKRLATVGSEYPFHFFFSSFARDRTTVTVVPPFFFVWTSLTEHLLVFDGGSVPVRGPRPSTLVTVPGLITASSRRGPKHSPLEVGKGLRRSIIQLSKMSPPPRPAVIYLEQSFFFPQPLPDSWVVSPPPSILLLRPPPSLCSCPSGPVPISKP